MKICEHVESHAHKLTETVLNQKDQNILKATVENAATSADDTSAAIFRTA